MSFFTTLDVSDNRLDTLPREFLQLKKLKALNVRNNPLKQPPPEIAKQGIEAIFEYLHHLPEQIVNETKLLLVGQGEVGKTCLAKRLIFNTFQHEKSTEGIDIFHWTITAPTEEQEEIRLNVWDFGGQEIYHATHQFFLTKRSVYLLVWNARKTKDYEHIYYWLHTIEAFGEESPIILVLTKANEWDDDLNMKDIKEQFPQVVGLYKVDNADARGIPALTEIIKEITWKLPHMQTVWIESWFKVRERLEQDEREWIEYKEFQRICQQEGLDAKQAAILDEYLHDLGVIIHFRDRVELRNMMILNPEWLSDFSPNILPLCSIGWITLRHLTNFISPFILILERKNIMLKTEIVLCVRYVVLLAFMIPVLFGCAAPRREHVESVVVVEHTTPSLMNQRDSEEIIEVPLIAGIEEALKGEEEPLKTKIATFPTIRRPKPREGKPYTGHLISINFQNADLVEVLDFFAEIAGLNLVVYPGVSGTVTLRLENVPWDQALDIILKMHNLRVAIE